MSVRDSVTNTLAQYAWSYDMDACKGIGVCFTEDAEVQFDTGGKNGRDAIVAELERKRLKYPEEVVLWHISSNILIQNETEYTADVKSWFTFMVRLPGEELKTVALGYYDDIFSLENGAWRIKKREVVLIST